MDTEVIKDSENMSSTLKMPFTPKSFLKKKLKTEKMFLDVTTWKEIEEISSKYPKVFISNTAANRNPNKKAVNWLPAKVVFFAKKALFL